MSPDLSADPADPSRTPIEARGIALTVLAVGGAIVLARYMQDVLIPFVLAGLVFYALDPLVDRLQRFRIPRGLGAAFAIMLVIGAVGLAPLAAHDPRHGSGCGTRARRDRSRGGDAAGSRAERRRARAD